MRARALLAVLGLALSVAATRQAEARAPLASELVAATLDDRRDDARGLLDLLSTLAHLDALSPDAALAALSRRAAGQGLAAARARLELAALRAEPAPLGILTTAWAVPVAIADHIDEARLVQLHRQLLAAGRVAPGQPLDADDRDRVWLEIADGPLGAIALDAFVPSAQRVVVQLALPFSIATRASGTLRLGASGDLAVSIASATEGRFLGTAQALERAVPDQVEAAVTLAPGQHVLLVTFRPNAGEPALLRVRFDLDAPPLAAAPSAWAGFAIPDVPPDLDWNADVARLGDSFDALVLARLMGLPDLATKRGRAVTALEERMATAPPSSRAYLLALGAVRRAEDRASLLLERLDLRCATCARDPSLLIALAAHTAERGQLTQALALVDEAARANPAPPAELVAYMRAHIARLTNAPEEVLVAYGVASGAPADIVARLAAASERVQLEVAQAALDVGRADVARAIYAALCVAYPGRIDLALGHMRAALAAGDVDLSITLAQRLAATHPERTALALEAAQQLIARARGDDRATANALIAATLPRLLWKPDALVNAGRLFESLGDNTSAIAAFSRALAVSPAHDEARRDLERLQGAEPVPLTLTVASVLDAPIVDADATFEVLGEEQFIKVRGDGSSTRWTRRVLRAQAVPEAREARTLTIPFDPTQSTVRVLSATVRHARGGKVTAKTLAEPAPDRQLQSIAEDWYGLYYDLRQLAIPFDRLERGDVIEVTWRIDPIGQLFPGVVDIFEVILDRVPKHLHRVIVETPAGIALRTRLSTPEGMTLAARETETTLPDGGTRHMVEVQSLPGLPLEMLAPGTAEVSPVWQATTFTSWRQVATWYRTLVEPQKVLTPAMKAFVARARANDAPQSVVLDRLVDYVTREIRYVGLEFGIHGYKPYRTDQVWSRRFGDCKDKATLLSALLAEAGIDGDVTLVRTRKQGRLAGALPSLALFDHAVLYIGSRAALVDPTATYYGLGELPREDQGAQILVLAPPELPADLEVSQVDRPARNGITGTYSITLEARGGAGIQGMVSFLGTQAPVYRSMLLDPSSQKVRLAEVLNRRYPGLALRDFRISDPSDKSRPFELVFHAHVPRFGQLQSEADGTLYISRPTGIDGHLERYASAERRRLPLVLGPPMRWDLTYRYVLPDGHRARELPRSGEATTSFGSYRVTWRDEGQVVTVRAELDYSVDQVNALDYPKLRDFVRGFDALVAMPLVLDRPAAPTEGPLP